VPYYFAYGTLQRRFSNYDAFADVLREPRGRFRTVDPYPLVVPRAAACTNPGCRFVHRMAALLPDRGQGERVEGDVYELDEEALSRLDTLETAYERRSVSVERGDERLEAQVYFVTDAEPWRKLLAAGEADAFARYTPELAEGPLKPCCVASPGHEPPHDVISPFD
jgi:gamma-glutamylcyclotransferase (GGCT)/AIG2-like uncharacterized protein YtfP